MVIVGRSKKSFVDANFATLSRFRVDGEWHPASTNHDWELFWSEITQYDGETVTLRKWDDPLRIEKDDRGEYVELTQEHQSIFAGGQYRTRLRPYHETGRTEIKPWMDSPNGSNND